MPETVEELREGSLSGASSSLRESRTYELIKRCIDVIGASIVLFLLSPLLAVIAVAVKRSGPGPIVFRQTRVGRGGKRFEILKFRTMRVGEDPGPLITGADDPRITSVGHVLRRWKLDELPQLVNVLRGEMSLVGPRPEVPRYVNMFAHDYRELLAVRPGLTDPAAILFRSEETMLGHAPDHERTYLRDILPRKLALSRSYVRRRSLRLDLRLIARTVRAIVGWPRSLGGRT